MKKAILLLLLIPLVFSGCEQKEEAPETLKSICYPATLHYLSGMVLGKQLCWEEKGPWEAKAGITFKSTGTGTCGKGYENIPDKYMAMEVVIAENEGAKSEKSISIALPFECDAYSTKEKFFDLLTVGNVYGVAQTNNNYGKFIITYKDANGSYTSGNNSPQSSNNVEILQIEKITTPGGSVRHLLRVKMRINCVLVDNNGKSIGKLENVDVRALFFRQTPWGENWLD